MERNGVLNFERKGDIAHLTISNPPRNRLPDPVIADPVVLKGWLNQPGLRGAIITGAGNNFSEGAELRGKEFDRLDERLDCGKKSLDALEQSPVPVVAAINGACFGGGLEIALACHLRVVGSTSLLGFPEGDLGLLPGLGGTWRATQVIGLRKALPFLLSSERVTGDRAVELGLAHYSVPRQEVVNKALEVLQRMIGDKPAYVIHCIMKAIVGGITQDRKSALALESKLFLELMQAKRSDSAEEIITDGNNKQTSMASL